MNRGRGTSVETQILETQIYHLKQMVQQLILEKEQLSSSEQESENQVKLESRVYRLMYQVQMLRGENSALKQQLADAATVASKEGGHQEVYLRDKEKLQSVLLGKIQEVDEWKKKYYAASEKLGPQVLDSQGSPLADLNKRRVEHLEAEVKKLGAALRDKTRESEQLRTANA